MCGLTGYVDFSKSSSKRILVEMTSTLHHRGPDGTGNDIVDCESAQIGLGHKRLSILDLSNLGRQPMYSIDGNYAILFNGEVYNFKSIKEDLLKKGYKFKSDSDSEVILYSLIEKGIKAVDSFIGMFAIVFIDIKNEKVQLIRDRVGVKPLYYCLQDGLFLFSSQIRAFHKHPSFEKQLNIDAIGEFLDFGYIKKEHSIFMGIKKVPPASWLEFDLKTRKLTKSEYWRLKDYFHKPTLNLTFAEAKDQLEHLLIDAFKLRMVSDVPVGVFLSGGIDSTTVAALLQKHHSTNISTFTIGFDDRRINEAEKASKIAEYLGTDHNELVCSEKELLDIFPRLAEIYDEPFADKSIIPSILVCEFARSKVTVALSADGGDEIFAGYDKYKNTLDQIRGLSYERGGYLKKTLYNFVYNRLDGLFGVQSKVMTKSYLEAVVRNAYPNPVEMMISAHRTFGPKDLNLLLVSGWQKEITVNSNEFLLRDDLSRILLYDFNDYLPDDILVKMDRAAMSISLEGREPLLDHRISEFVAQIPSNFKYSEGITKNILRTINHDYIPKELTEGEKKGFSIPKKQWLETHLNGYVEEYLSESRIQKDGIFNYEYINELKKSFRNGSKHNRIWNLLIFNMWLERWM